MYHSSFVKLFSFSFILQLFSFTFSLISFKSSSDFVFFAFSLCPVFGRVLGVSESCNLGLAIISLIWPHRARQNLEVLLQCFWGPTMDEDTMDFLRTCTVCSQHKPHHQAPAGLLQPFPIPHCPWSHISLDFSLVSHHPMGIQSSSPWLTSFFQNAALCDPLCVFSQGNSPAGTGWHLLPSRTTYRCCPLGVCYGTSAFLSCLEIVLLVSGFKSYSLFYSILFYTGYFSE